MEIPQEVDNFIKDSIDHALGLSVSDHSLQSKLQSLETSNYRLRAQYLSLQSRLKEKEDSLELARAEATMNAQAIKKFVEENQKLAAECTNLVSQCSKWERECSLYDHDREALMEFGNEADERAKEAEVRVSELEDKLKRVTEEVHFYKRRCGLLSVDSSSKDEKPLEQTLLNALVASLVNKNEVVKTALAFLEANSGVEECRELLQMWNCLTPETQSILALAAHVRTLQKDKDHLRTNLYRAEEEAKVLFEENSVLDEENKRLLKLYSERKQASSGGKHGSSTATKRNKRKLSPGLSSPVEKKIDFNDVDSPRRPLSPLKENSPGSKLHKK